jgi:hypothetical protein
MRKQNGLGPLWAAASAGVLGWLFGVADMFHTALPIAFGAFVPLLLVPVVLRGAVGLKIDAAAAAAGKGAMTGADVFLRR